MNMLIVAATEGEIRMPLPEREGLSIHVLITGVGMVATTYALTKYLKNNKYDFVLQVGVGGSFDPNLDLGALVFVTMDQFGDLGAEDHDKYLDVFEMGLLKNEGIFRENMLYTRPHELHEKMNLPHAMGMTVNTVSGNAETIRRRAEKFEPTVESMEGAAFHYVCLQENVPFAQVRAISNYVTPRDKSQWKMKEAVTSLNDWLIGFINSL